MTGTLRKVILLFVAFVIIALMILAKVTLRKPEHQIDKEKPVNIQREDLVIGEKNDWPMFHAGPKLHGCAQDNLPDSLELLWKFKTDDEIKSSAAIVGDSSEVAYEKRVASMLSVPLPVRCSPVRAFELRS